MGGIFRDYNQTQINQIQVSKQADVLALFFLLEDLFPREVKAATWDYYSERTIHDSSLSLCTHAVLAADMRAPANFLCCPMIIRNGCGSWGFSARCFRR